jgi:hypothetical protein
MINIAYESCVNLGRILCESRAILTLNAEQLLRRQLEHFNQGVGYALEGCEALDSPTQHTYRIGRSPHSSLLLDHLTPSAQRP